LRDGLALHDGFDGQDGVKVAFGTRRDTEILLCPGPVMLSAGVKSALAECEIGHRDTRFSQLHARLRHNSRHVFRSGDEHSILFIGGPATAAIEAVCATVLPPDAQVIVPVNGSFGRRIVEILKVHRIPHTQIDFGFGKPFDLDRIEAVIAAERGRGLTVLAMTHHETSAGLLNPVTAVGALVRQYGLKLIVDATSSAGVEDVDVTRDGIDACITTSGKCLHGAPGLSLVCVRRELLAASKVTHARSYSVNLHRFHDQMECNDQTPFTASVPLFLALDQAIEELLEQGIEERRRVYRHRRQILAAGFAQLGLPLFPLPPGSEAASIMTVGVPEALGFEALYAAVKDNGYLIYACKPPLLPRYFQIAVMGELADDHLYDFLDILQSLTTTVPAHYRTGLA
jgi:2-aminoethylphosphonate-pyruvate transaminase